MSDSVFREHKLTDAIPKDQQPPETPPDGGNPHATPDTTAEQMRQRQKGEQAQNAQGDLRDRLVEIGKANHMGGRSTGRKSDQ
ncbi:MAG: hypothetical protein U0800_03170 [Isosphaeraceae bacterium]